MRCAQPSLGSFTGCLSSPCCAKLSSCTAEMVHILVQGLADRLDIEVERNALVEDLKQLILECLQDRMLSEV